MASSRLERIGTIFTRKEGNTRLIKCLTEVVNQSEANYNSMKDNEKKLEELTNTFVKSVQQATSGHKQILKVLKEIQTCFKQDVEGLLTRGAMKPDDRPLWFDVYKAFPPQVEPKFARPKPEIKPIRQIFYHEDVIRAKFHSKGHGLNTNMLNASSETQTRRLLCQYEKLKSDGIAEDELIEKCVAAVDAERKAEVPKAHKIPEINPESVSAQVLSEANLKDIFKE